MINRNFLYPFLAIIVVEVSGTSLAPRTAPLPLRAPSLREAVELLDGDSLGGKFLGFDANKGILWKHPAFAAEMHIDPAKAKRITLHRPGLPKNARHHTSKVVLRNGDQIFGDLLSLKDGKLVLDTWYAGKLSLPQAALRQLIPGHPGQTLLAGPEAYKGWVVTGPQGAEIFKGAGGKLPEEILKRIYAQNQKARDPAKTGWAVEGMSLVSRDGTGLIGREIPFAEGTQIEFDVKGVGKPAFRLNLFIEDIRSQKFSKGFCVCVLNNGYILFGTDGENDGARIGKIDDNFFEVNHVAIQIAPSSGKVTVTFNRQVRVAYPEKINFLNKGKGLVIKNFSNDSLHITNFRVSRWNGAALEQKPRVDHQGEKDLAVLSNADRMQGRVLGIAGGKLLMQSDLGELPMPLDRVQSIYFGKVKNPPSRPAPGTVRLKLKDGGAMTGKLLEWKDGVVKFKSAIFGEVILNGGMVSGIEFIMNRSRVGENSKEPKFPHGGSTAEIEKFIEEKWGHLLREEKLLLEKERDVGIPPLPFPLIEPKLDR
jgi:hypothetical protein